MSSKLNSGVRYAYMRGAAAWERLRVKADMVCLQVILCDPYLSALEAFAKTRYTNRRYLTLHANMLTEVHSDGGTSPTFVLRSLNAANLARVLLLVVYFVSGFSLITVILKCSF